MESSIAPGRSHLPVLPLVAGKPVHPFSDLNALRLDILTCLNYVPQAKKSAKKCRHRFINCINAKMGYKLTVEYTHNYKAFFSAIAFDLTGSYVWEAVVQAMGYTTPCTRYESVREAFDAAEAGLNEAQQAEARRLCEQPLTWAFQRQQEALAAQALKLEQDALKERKRIEAAKQLALKQQAFLASAKEIFSQPFVALEKFDEAAQSFLHYFHKKLTLAHASSALGMHAQARQTLEFLLAQRKLAVEQAHQAQAKRASEEAQARKKEREWERSLIPSYKLPEQLRITKTEYQNWLVLKRLKPAMMREFSKWGKVLQAPLFDPADIGKITPAVLAAWRAEDAEIKHTNRVAGAVKGAPKAAKTRSIKQAVNLHAYEKDFDAARAMKRTVTLLTGPTNSGKTHDAMLALAAAPSGIYLAPLRLLALENYERLRAQGVPVSLMTGEERIYDPLAKHVCATVEMCDFVEVVDVAVIDEVQLLGDEQRGWAWTAALLGVPARTVYACGASHASQAVKALLACTGDTVDEQAFERKTPLIIDKEAIGLEQIQPGDALVAFSRKDVLQFASLLRKRNLSVSVIYGALSPEVRRSQAQAFVEGRTQVVVATDAIGMGLNLPIKRMVFTSTQKYDGVAMRTLTSSQAQQIAGRAGRFGLHEEGHVTAFGSDNLRLVRTLMGCTPGDIEGPFPVMPTWSHVQKALLHMGTNDVVKVLEFFDRISFGGAYKKADMAGVIAKADFAQGHGLSPRAEFSLACAPADLENNNDQWVLAQAIRALVRQDCMDIPRSPVQLDGGIANNHTLGEAEGYARKLSLFAWLGCRFPGLANLEGLAEQRQTLTLFINRALESHKADFYRKSRKRYQWKENWDFEGDEDD